jgi:S-formylglutathione hydrolase FrmB
MVQTNSIQKFSGRWIMAILGLVFSTIAIAQAQSSSPDPVTGPTSIFTVYDGETVRKGEFAFSEAFASPHTVSTEYLDSKLMGKKMPYNILLPANYFDKDSTGRRFPVVYLLHGLTGNFNNWASRTKIADYAASYDVIIVTPEGGDGWYTDNLKKDGDKYESYIINELIPEIDKKYRTIDRRDKRAVAGLSMGGYGSIKFGMKYPDKFVVVGSFSGAIGAASITEKEFPGAIGKSIDEIFGPADGVIRKANDPFDLLRRAPAESIKQLPFIYLDCGTEDFLFKNNRDFVNLLIEKKVAHEYRELPGAHNWQYWDGQVQEFLRVSSRFLN